MDNLLQLVKSLPKPQKVPPPTLVPLTLSNFPSPSTYMMANCEKIKKSEKIGPITNLLTVEKEMMRITFIMLTPDPIFTRR